MFLQNTMKCHKLYRDGMWDKRILEWKVKCESKVSNRILWSFIDGIFYGKCLISKHVVAFEAQFFKF